MRSNLDQIALIGPRDRQVVVRSRIQDRDDARPRIGMKNDRIFATTAIDGHVATSDPGDHLDAIVAGAAPQLDIREPLEAHRLPPIAGRQNAQVLHPVIVKSPVGVGIRHVGRT